MSYLLRYVDGMIEQWKTVSDKVADAAKLCNVELVKVQVSMVVNRDRMVCCTNLLNTATKSL